jgi:hypothetical protein
MQVTSILKGDPTIVNRYLADQLAEAERSAFEAQLVADPDLLREVEATARLKVGLHQLRETGQLDALIAGERSHTPLFFSAAAALAVLVLGISLLRWNTDAGAPMLAASLSSLVDQSGSPLPIAGAHAIFRKRADAYDAVIELPASRQAIELRVLPDASAVTSTASGADTRYRVSLSLIGASATAEASGSIERLQAADDGFVTMFVDSSRLSPGTYQLVVESETGDGERRVADSFVIKVTPARTN